MRCVSSISLCSCRVERSRMRGRQAMRVASASGPPLPRPSGAHASGRDPPVACPPPCRICTRFVPWTFERARGLVRKMGNACLSAMRMCIRPRPGDRAVWGNRAGGRSVGGSARRSGGPGGRPGGQAVGQPGGRTGEAAGRPRGLAVERRQCSGGPSPGLLAGWCPHGSLHFKRLLSSDLPLTLPRRQYSAGYAHIVNSCAGTVPT